MSKIVFSVKTRDLKIPAKKLRAEHVLPANVFGAGESSQAVQVAASKFQKLYNQAGESGLIYLKLTDAKKELPVLIDEIQFDPLTDEPIHVAFKQVSLKEKITTEVPVELVGEFELPEAVLVTVRDTIEVEALPTDLPEKFVIDVAQFAEIGQSVTLADLEFDRSKVSLVVGEEGEDAPVVLVQEVKEEEEPEPETELSAGEEVVAAEEEGAEGEVAAEDQEKELDSTEQGATKPPAEDK
ncbi:MAG: 50S ribosomal protein L25 [Candidatus Pacebacteria bacterium]|nr:50S ribosomal protein L25 [Candidatus Paceibacterota bacterium]